MEHHGIFQDVLIILAVSAGALFVFGRLKLPSLLGFIVAGLLAGPHGFGLVKAAEEVEFLAEIGVIFLLFTIGIEFSVESILRVRRMFLVGGSFQVIVTAVLGTLLPLVAGIPVGRAILAGFLVTLSSTAVVLKILQQRAEMDTLQGRFSLAVLIYQDLVIVPMLLAVPLLTGDLALDPKGIAIFLGKAGALLGGIVLSARWILPGLLHQVARTRDPEIFLVAVVVLGFGIAYLTYLAGLSLAMGAFFAGLILSESQYAQRALGELLPLRDLFMGFFFVSVGMLLDLGIVAESPGIVIGGVILLIFAKALIVTIGGLLVGLPLRAAVLGGIALAQVGEFSFVLAEAGLDNGLIDPAHFQRFLGVTVFSMMVTPLLIALSPRIAEAVVALPFPAKLKLGALAEEERPSIRDHLVVIGFGLIGRHVVEAAESAGIPYAVLEANSDTARIQREAGRHMYHGDAAQRAALDHVRIAEARVALVAIGDVTGTRRVVEQIRSMNPSIHIIARTRYLSEAETLRDLGANEVIPEEYETSIEIFTRVLAKYLVPKEQVEAFIRDVRGRGYKMMRTPSKVGPHPSDIAADLSDLEIRVLTVGEGAGAVGRSVAGLNLRRDYGILVISIRRGDDLLGVPDANDPFQVGDRVVLIGQPDLLVFAEGIFKSPPVRADDGGTPAPRDPL